MVFSLNLGVHRARLLLSKIWMDIMASMESMRACPHGTPSQWKLRRKHACMHNKQVEATRAFGHVNKA